MGNVTREVLNEDLERLEKKIALIGSSDPDKYKIFMERLKGIQENAFGILESDFEKVKYAIIQEMTNLQYDFDSYMDGSDYDVHDGLDVFTTSGKSKLKEYKISLYRDIVKDFKKLDTIDISYLKKLREKWNTDKVDEYLEFTEIEKSAVEEYLSEALLEYQIKYAQKNGSLPEDVITDYADKDEYKSRIKDRLLLATQDSSLSAMTKLEIEELLKIEDLEALLKNKTVWNSITNRKMSYTPEQIDNMLGKITSKSNNLPTVVEQPKVPQNYMICTLRKKGLFGKEKEKNIKVKIKNNIVKLPKRYKKDIVSVYMSEGITEIEEYAFSDCTKLENVVLPATLKEIGRGAFLSCKSLKSINFPESLNVIREYAFKYCESMEDVSLNSGIQRIESEAFAYSGIKELNLLESDFYSLECDSFDPNLQRYIFNGCQNLKKVILPRNLKYIPRGMFKGCSALEEITFPEELNIIEGEAFCDCSQLRDLTNLPECLECIYRDAFSKCKNLKKIKLPTFIQKVYSECFDNDIMFDEFILPKQLMNVSVLDELGIKKENILTVPEDATGFLYSHLGLQPGEKISFVDLRLKIAEKNAREIEIEPEKEAYTRIERGKMRVKYRVKVEPTIVDVNKSDLNSTNEVIVPEDNDDEIEI